MKTLQKGFTLIELLIVIAVLGVLAVAVLSAINPIEQINRGKDTGSRSDSEQVINAIDRFYTSKAYYPWMIGADPLMAGYISPTLLWQRIDLDTPGAQNILDNLSGAAGEIKSSFVSRLKGLSYNHLQIFNAYDAATMPNSVTYVCFTPLSNDFMDSARKRCCEMDGAGVSTLPGDYPPLACSGVNCGVTPFTGAALSCLP